MARATQNSSPSNNHHFVFQAQFISHLNSCTNSHHFVIPLTPSYFSLHQSFPYSLILPFSLSSLHFPSTYSSCHLLVLLHFRSLSASDVIQQARIVFGHCHLSHVSLVTYLDVTSIRYRDLMAFSESTTVGAPYD
jgi:hypothetical protein